MTNVAAATAEMLPPYVISRLETAINSGVMDAGAHKSRAAILSVVDRAQFVALAADWLACYYRAN